MEVSLEDDGFSAHPLAVPIPNALLRGTSSVAELGAWLAIGEAWADIVAHFLSDDQYVVDLGCGPGKLARFLYLNPRIRYVGLDLFLPAIAWCQRAFAPLAGSRFQFEHFDGHSEAYNPQGKLDPATYVFPFGGATVDMVVCGSLFTHLVEPTCRHYLREIRRVLKTGGRAIISIHTEPAPGTSFSGSEGRIDIAPDYFKQLAASAGLRELETVGLVYGQMVIAFENA
jgi:SAM-dependent methyltransferase